VKRWKKGKIKEIKENKIKRKWKRKEEKLNKNKRK
jgi:hypothetical protein